MYAVPSPDPDAAYRRRAAELLTLLGTVRATIQSSSALRPAQLKLDTFFSVAGEKQLLVAVGLALPAGVAGAARMPTPSRFDEDGTDDWPKNTFILGGHVIPADAATDKLFLDDYEATLEAFAAPADNVPNQRCKVEDFQNKQCPRKAQCKCKIHPVTDNKSPFDPAAMVALLAKWKVVKATAEDTARYNVHQSRKRKR